MGCTSNGWSVYSYLLVLVIAEVNINLFPESIITLRRINVAGNVNPPPGKIEAPAWCRYPITRADITGHRPRSCSCIIVLPGYHSRPAGPLCITGGFSWLRVQRMAHPLVPMPAPGLAVPPRFPVRHRPGRPTPKPASCCTPPRETLPAPRPQPGRVRPAGKFSGMAVLGNFFPGPDKTYPCAAPSGPGRTGEDR